MAELQRGKSYVTLTGNVKLTENSFTGEQTGKNNTNYKYKRINLGVQTSEGNIVYCELMGGYNTNKPVIYGISKTDNKPFEISWQDRLNEKIVDSVADFRIHKVGIVREEGSERVQVKKFLSPFDMHDYLQENLKDGMEVTVKGTFKFSEYNDETQRRIEIQSIFLKGKEAENKAKAIQTILLDENSYKKVSSKDVEEGEVIVSAYAVDYVSKKDGKEVKKNMAFPIPIVFKLDKDNIEKSKKMLEAVFKVKKGKVRELGVELDIIEGYETKEISDADIDLSPEIKELIELGFYSEEEAKSKMTVRGNKTSKLVFVKPNLVQTEDNRGRVDKDDDKYVAEDLFVSIEEEDTGDIGEEFVDETNTEVDDDDWLKEFGLDA